MRDFIPFLLLLFFIAAFLRIDFFFTVAYLFFIVVLLARGWTRRTAQNVRFERRFTDRAFQGEQVEVSLTAQNLGRLPVPWLELQESIPVELVWRPFQRQVLSLRPGERRQMRYRLDCRRRGVYAVGPLQARTGDLLGVQDRELPGLAPGVLIVYPRIVLLQRLALPTNSPLVALPSRAPLFEDPARVTGVRDYQHGDLPRRIHWTATASAGRLLVKQYQPAIARESLIYLDLNAESYEPRSRLDSAELAILIAASLANHILVRDRLPVGLACGAFDAVSQARMEFFLPPRRERAHLMDLLTALARVQLIAGEFLPETLRRVSTRLPWGATLALITGQASDALMRALAGLRRAGFAVTLILVRPGRPSLDVAGQAKLLGVPLHLIWEESELKTWR